jgi:AcrR family transcriptional regulator
MPSNANPLEHPPAPPRRRRRAARGDGNLLRSQILNTANELMTGAGSAGVSIRAISQRLGVTAPSIYLHFDDKQHLLQALAADAFTELDQTTCDTTYRAATPADRLLAYGSAYVAFALQRPEHYRIALMSHRPPALKTSTRPRHAPCSKLSSPWSMTTWPIDHFPDQTRSP